MAQKAREIIVDGLTMDLYPQNADKTDWEHTATQLCGVDSLSFSDGSTEEKDVTDFCDAAKGQRNKVAGLKEPGTLSINLVRYDWKQPGQKLINDAPANSRFKLVVAISVGTAAETLTLELKKKTDASFEIKPGENISGSIEFIVDNKPKWGDM